MMNLTSPSYIPTDQEIDIAKLSTPYFSDEPRHEHNDCIRIAYLWLDHQKKTKRTTYTAGAIKHDVERWAQRYISTSDLLVAAHMHPDIIVNTAGYTLNITRKYVTPPISLLNNIPEAFKHPNYAG